MLLEFLLIISICIGGGLLYIANRIWTMVNNNTNNNNNKHISARHVLLFIPNLIGYFRISCSLWSFVLMILVSSSSSSSGTTTTPYFWIPLLAITLYLISFVADLVDGWAARIFQQSSHFGGMLDMITDRCSTLGLLYVLGSSPTVGVWSRMTYLFLMILDISSHWSQMHSTCLISQGQHHKSRASNSGRNVLVQWYYHYYWFFAYLCVGAEFTYMITYGLQHVFVVASSSTNTTTGSSTSWFTTLVRSFLLLTWYLCVPGCIMKQLVNLAQLSSASHALARFDALQIQRGGSSGGGAAASTESLGEGSETQYYVETTSATTYIAPTTTIQTTIPKIAAKTM